MNRPGQCPRFLGGAHLQIALVLKFFVQRALDARLSLAARLHEGVQINHQRHCRGPALGVQSRGLRIQSTTASHVF